MALVEVVTDHEAEDVEHPGVRVSGIASFRAGWRGRDERDLSVAEAEGDDEARQQDPVRRAEESRYPR